jgi:hypothetical protein
MLLRKNQNGSVTLPRSLARVDEIDEGVLSGVTCIPPRLGFARQNGARKFSSRLLLGSLSQPCIP